MFIRIHVKSLNGNKIQINVDEDATVKQVKLILQKTEGVCSCCLRLIFKGKLLTDTDKLKDKGYKKGVEAGMTLYHAIMLRGGC